MKNYLEFEKEIKTLEDEMELLKSPGNESISEVDTNKISQIQTEIKSTFHKLKADILALNISLFEKGYDYAKNNIPLQVEVPSSPADHHKILIDGNTALSMGIIDSGIKFYSGYPITPASSILHTLAKEFSHYGGIVHQAEDEISAIGTAIGSYYAGKPAITATSGPG